MTDPWTWTVEQVVYNLCDSADLWSDRLNSKLPNAALFRQKLIEQEIDGATLIEHVDKKALKEDLGVSALGEVASILYAIEKLKDLSPRYVEQQAQRLFRQESVSRTASELRRPQLSFKSPFSGAVSNIAFSPKRLPSPTPMPNSEPPVASGLETNLVTTANGTHDIVEPPKKKRRVQLISLPTTGTETKDAFLGKRLVLDSLFFDQSNQLTEDDTDDDETDEFTILRSGQAPSTGHELFVGRRIKHYLQLRPKNLKHAKAILQPYPSTVPTTHNPHAMMFSVEEGKARMRMCNPARPDERIEQTDDYDNEWSFLSKWDTKKSKVLPGYGESEGSDAGYGGSLLNEFEEEEAEREAESSNNKQLSQDEVIAVIDAYVEEQEQIWAQEKLPRERGKAWGMWQKSRGSRRRPAVSRLKHDIDQMSHRLETLRQCILDEVWIRSQTIQLRNQCRSLEPTIDVRMQLRFELAVLQKPQAPERVRVEASHRVKDKAIKQHDLDEESLHSESTMNFIENDDGRLSPVSSNSLKHGSPRPRPLSDQPETVLPLPASSAPDADDIVDLTGSSPIRQSSSPRDRPSFPDYRSFLSHKQTRRIKSPSRDSSSPADTKPVDWSAHPEHATEHQVRAWSYEELEDQSDRKRLIMKLRATLATDLRDSIDDRFSQFDEDKMHKEIKLSIKALRKDEQTVKGFKADTSRVILTIAKLWICWNSCSHHWMNGKIAGDILSDAGEFESFEAFYDFCHSLVQTNPQANDVVEDLEEPTASPSLSRKPGKKLSRDKGSQRLQQAGLARIAAAEQAKSQLESSGLLEGVDNVIINPLKKDHQEYIFVNRHVASRVKPHQVEGIQFIWRELVTADAGGMQGCLLAHTMGLGKSMQAITFLVTLAEAAASDDPTIVEQIPKELHKSRTLLLCPPTLIENWRDEWNQWQPSTKPVGEVRTTNNSATRLDNIRAWYNEGGVLIVSYDLLSSLVANKARKHRGGGEATKALSEEDHTFVLKCLLDGPNIVVADEAHKLKNKASQISQISQRFRTTSRLALTGSPLANNLTEYYVMIDWIAPGYLGDFEHFKISYQSPIEIGNYADASKYEQRRSVKKLKALMADIEPKVQRKDVHAISKDLKQKTEFVLNIALTPLQYETYKTFVQSLTEQLDSSVATARLFDWLSVLGLLCDHPSLFKDKIEKRHEKRAAKAHQEHVDDEDGSPDISSMELPDTLFQKEKALFDTVQNINSLIHGNKMRLIKQILLQSQKVGDKVLIFSHLLPTLDYLQALIEDFDSPMSVARIDGSTKMDKRQQISKDMNADKYDVCLVSTRAGGLGLNIPGANRVVLVDFSWNPQHEIQAIGRAYRLGQQKEVFVYHLVTAGTFEVKLHQITIFKQQLAARVVDKKTPNRAAVKVKDMLLEPEETVQQEDLDHARGLDKVLDSILSREAMRKHITSITTTDTLHKEADEALTAEEEAEVQQMIQDDKVRKADPALWAWKQLQEQRKQSAPSLSTQQGLQPELSHDHQAAKLANSYSIAVPRQKTSVRSESGMPVVPTQSTEQAQQAPQQRIERVSTLPPPPPMQVNAAASGANVDDSTNDADMDDVQAQEPANNGVSAVSRFLRGAFGGNGV